MSELDIDLQDYAEKCRAVARSCNQDRSLHLQELNRFGITLLVDYEMRRPGSRNYIEAQMSRIRTEEGL
jgi:hypothetical protein